MFRASDVDALFSNTNRSLQRSMLLFDEHAPTTQTSVAGRSPTAASASACWPSPPLTSSGSSGSGAHYDGSLAVVQSLRGLGQFRAFVEAATGMVERLGQEAVGASPAMARQRQRGAAWPVLARTTKGLRVQHLWARSPDAQHLWWRGDIEEGDNRAGTGEDTEHTGAYVAGRLLLAALCADVTHAKAACLRLVRQWWERPALTDAALMQLLRSAGSASGAALPEAVMGTVVRSFTTVVQRLCQPRPLSAGLLLVPGWVAYVALHAPASVRATLLLRPLSSLAAELLSLFLRDDRLFELAGRQCLCYSSTVAAQVLTTTAPGDDPRRRAAFLRSLYDALLLPMEGQFTADAARPGMAQALYTVLARPAANTHAPQLLKMVAEDDTTMRNIVHTVQYRLLRLVEVVGRAEVARESGAGHASTRQKRYESLLKQSHGKITMHLLSAVAEDRQLVLEASEARAPTGHVLHRLHDGSEDAAAPVVYLYVDKGAVLYKLGRARSFTTAKTVEEIFEPFSS